MQALIESMKEQQKQFMDVISSLAKTEPAVQPLSSPPKFESFDKTKEKWEQYLLRFKQHLQLHNVIDGEKKRAFLLSCLDPETFGLLQNLFEANIVSEQTFDALTEKLSAHYKSSTHVQAARYSFYNCSMKPGQSYAEWVATLRGIAKDCQFTCKSDACHHRSYVDDQIGDVIIQHSPHAEVRRQCLIEPNITLQTVLSKAEVYTKTLETDKLLTGKGSSSSTAVSVNKMSSQYKKQKPAGRPPKKSPFQQADWKRCKDCHVKHSPNNCPYKTYTCHKCKKVGHLKSVCKAQLPNKALHIREEIEQAGSVFSCSTSTSPPSEISCNVYEHRGKQIWLNVQIQEKEISFLWDTGSTCTMISAEVYEQLGSPPCNPFSTTLLSYGGKRLKVKGQCIVDVHLGNLTRKNLSLVVVNENGSNLLGLDWSDSFGLTENGVSVLCSIQQPASPASTNQLQEILDSERDECIASLKENFSDVFSQKLGRCTKYKAGIHLKADVTPAFFKPRSLPFAMKEKVSDELNRLVDIGVLTRIDFADWAAPIVVVNKPDGRIRICGDFKALNRSIKIDQHPLPTLDSLLEKLQGGRFYSKIDLADAYLQIELEESAKKLCVINTPFGLFQYNRMCFGVASSPAQFQRCMDHMISGLPGVAAYLDDLIVTGSSEREHRDNLTNLLQRLSEYGFAIKSEKCEFFKNCVEYLGHVIDKDGKRPSECSVEAIKLLKRPQNLQELQAFLGKINYYGRFISNLPEKAHPLHALLKKSVEFKWTDACEKAFEVLKSDIICATKLSHFDESKPLILATDASQYGVGAALMQMQDGVEKPLAHASKTLTETQKRYSQIEREALAIIYGVTKFHQYLYGRKFKLICDHKPLVSIFSPAKSLPTLTIQRLQRYAITLMAYQFEIEYKPTGQHGNADGLSRLCSRSDPNFDRLESRESAEIACSVSDVFDALPITCERIRTATLCDVTLKKVSSCIQRSNWPKSLIDRDADVRAFNVMKNSLCVENDVIVLQRDGSARVVIPLALRDNVLTLLHEGHWGITRMKQMARRYVWWPNISSDIEMLVQRCEQCRQASKAPDATYQPWPQTVKPWERIHLDFAGPFLGKMWLVCVDAHSKFPYVAMLNVGQTTTKSTVNSLEHIFSIEGLPDTIVTDNGTQFVSHEFENYCAKLNIRHVTSPVFHPASNGEAERFVQTLKKGLSKNVGEGKELVASLRLVLATYRTTPHPGINWSTPAEVLHGRQPKNLLSLFLPNHAVSNRKLDDCVSEGSAVESDAVKKYDVGSLVYARNYASGPKWYPGEVTKILGNVLFMIRTDRGLWKRHKNQLQPRFCDISDTSVTVSHDNSDAEQFDFVPNDHNDFDPDVNHDDRDLDVQPESIPATDPGRQYPRRIRRPPERYQAGF